MTASHRRHLELVDDAETETADYHWDADDQFIGSLMWLDVEQAQRLLELVPAEAIWQPVARWAYELIRHVTDHGNDPDPDPVAILATGRHRNANDAMHPGMPPTGRQHKQLALYLAEAYSQAQVPQAAAHTYAREVLDADYRRAFDAFGIRMQELAASGADRADLTEQFGIIRDRLADLWRRCQAATPPERKLA